MQSVACTSTATLGKASGVVGPLPAETVAPGHDRSKRYKSSSSQQRVLAARPTRHQFSNISEPYEHKVGYIAYQLQHLISAIGCNVLR